MHTELAALTLLFVCSAVTSYVATGIVRKASEQAGLVDRPDDERKHHASATPRLGGLAIIFGFGFPLLLLAGNSHAAELVAKNISYLFAMLASGSLIVGLGVYDDIVGANAPKKFLIQTAAAVILVSFGFKFTFVSVAGQVIELGFVGALASVVWIVGVINAVNFIDGIDTLATVVAITIAVSFAIVGIIRQDVFSLVIMIALAGSLIGFFPWNRPPARIFMGDSGSLFIGLILAACSLARPSKSPTAFAIGGPMLALALPVIDTLFVMSHRFRGASTISERIRRMFNADRRHIHHILVARFGSTFKATLIIWIVTLFFAASAVMTAYQGTKLYGYTLGIVGFVALTFLRYWHRQAEPLQETEEAVAGTDAA
jgi:UDP-GlcNAc:undecaprenyl-phosphate GlcNAc-1-phosphate transferase